MLSENGFRPWRTRRRRIKTRRGRLRKGSENIERLAGEMRRSERGIKNRGRNE
jgi:hypothetical protein